METRSQTRYGPCRCCLARGHHKELNNEYFFNGIREVYNEIFQQVFNLILSSEPQLTTLICSTCIYRLRDATSFRMMVVSTEKQLLHQDSISKQLSLDTIKDRTTEFVDVLDEDTTTILETRSDVKEESESIDEVKQEAEETHNVTDSGDYEDSDFVIDRDDLTSESQCDDAVPGEASFLACFKHVQPLPTIANLPDICPEYCRHLTLLKDIKVVPQTIARLVADFEIAQETRSAHQQYITEKLAHIVNTSTILEHSNVTPFRSKSRQGFPCFYCRNIFDNLEKLQEHIKDHKKHEILKVLRTYGAECLVVYVDITDLKCNICKKNIKNLTELKLHLVNVHKKKMHQDFSDRVIPFKISNTSLYECQLCGFNFETFGSIERHMNVHFRNYVCKECGTGFVTRYRLKVHVKSMHAGGTHPCEVCGKIFTTTQKHKNHVNTVHKMMKRFKCTKCPERFAEYFRRQKHMVQVHGFAPLKYKCNVCEKSFDRRYTLSRHMKRDHLEERDFQCELCSYKCFTKNELRVHMVKHNGERIFECSVCKKAYARKKTLKEHLRIHNNDRRFACSVCGQAFVQKCSLKGHLKTHHLEFNLQ